VAEGDRLTWRRRGTGRPRDLAVVVVAVLTACAVLVPAGFWLFGRDERVPTYGPSMRPTLRGAEPLKIDFEAYDRATPRLEDIVALQGPEAAATSGCAGPDRPRSPCATPSGTYGDEFLIKRIVAGPGDTIAIARDGRAIRNGRRLPEPYVRRCRPADWCALPRPITVPPGHYFVLGDNRRNSTDSRYWGPVPLSALDGRVELEN
jgi:signal peptidase I